MLVLNLGIATLDFNPLRTVDIPEYLDIAKYADNVHLPSERKATHHMNVKIIYRLQAVGMFVPPIHYVASVRSEGYW